MRNTFPLSLLAVMSLLFLASCTTAGTSTTSSSSSSSGIVETSRGDHGRPPREGGRGHRPPADTTDTVAPTQAMSTDVIQKAETAQTPTPTVTPKTPTPEKADTTTPLKSTPTPAPQVSTRTPTTSRSVTYSTDHGKERVTASFTVGTDSSGVITSVSASATSADRESQQYIRRFNSAAQTQIVGKKTSSLSLSAVSGASDTTDAFLQVVNSL